MSTPQIHALVIEDESAWQNLLEEILTDQGIVVDVVDNLQDAIQALREVPYRLAIVDVSLHETNHHNRDGLSVLKAIQNHAPGCISILLTGYATVELAVDAITQHGAFTCLRKERFIRSEFREVIRDALAAPSAYLHNRTTAAEPNLPVDSILPSRHETYEPTQDANVLIVEDDAGWKSILSELLLERGYHVQLCSGYGEALGYLGVQRFNLAIVDLALTGSNGSPTGVSHQSDGLRLLQYMRSSGIPTIVVSGITLPEDIQRIYQDYDVTHFLEKQSFNRQAFVSAVEKALAAPGTGTIIDTLTRREQQVLDLLVKGMTNREIAHTLVISTNTVKRHLKSIFKKMNTQTRAATVAKALRSGDDF